MVGLSAGALAVVVLLIAGSIALPAAHGPEATTGSFSAATTTSIDVAATGDYGYQPDTFEQIATNTTISVTFTDESILAHTFTIIGKEGWVIPSTYSWTQIDNLAYGNSPPALFNANVSGSGDVNTSSFHSPGPGWYEFVCTVSGHFQSGMYGFIAFGKNLPSNLTTPSRVGVGGVSISPLEGAVAAGVVLVLVIAFVAWRRRRIAHRLPPESGGRE